MSKGVNEQVIILLSSIINNYIFLYIMHCLGCAIYLPSFDDILKYFNLERNT